MSTRKSALLKSLAKQLTPKVQDPRRFRLAKSMTFNAEEARKIAHAINITRAVVQNEELTFRDFLVGIASSGFGVEKLSEIEIEQAEETMKHLFTLVGATQTVVVE